MSPNSYFNDYYLSLISVGIEPMTYDYKNTPFMVAGSYYKTREEAEKNAKIYATKFQKDTPIWKAVALVKFPVPQMEVEELN